MTHPARGVFGVDVGTLNGLSPGKVVDLPVTYTNPYSYAIRVTNARIAATLVSSSQGVPVCSSSHLASAPWSSGAGLLVSRHGSAETTLPIRLEPDAPDACKGARWRLTVTAEAVHG